MESQSEEIDSIKRKLAHLVERNPTTDRRMGHSDGGRRGEDDNREEAESGERGGGETAMP